MTPGAARAVPQRVWRRGGVASDRPGDFRRDFTAGSPGGSSGSRLGPARLPPRSGEATAAPPRDEGRPRLTFISSIGWRHRDPQSSTMICRFALSQESTLIGMGMRLRCGYERILPAEPFVSAICRPPAFSVMVGNDRAVLILDRFCLISEPEPIVRPETDPTFAVEE